MENTSTISPEKSEHVKLFDPRETLDVDAIKRLRDTQKIVYEEAVEVHKENGYDQALAEHYASNVVDVSADLYLLGQGLTKDDPRYDEYKAGLNTVSILAVPEDEWVAAWDKTGNDGVLVLGQSGRDKTRALYTGLTGEMYLEAGVNPVTHSDETENNQPNDAHEALKEQLSGLRDNLASLSAKRQGNLLDVGIEKYDAALNEYNKKFTELARLELAEQLDDDQLDQTQKNALVIRRYFEEEQTLRSLTKEKMENTPVGKFVNWFTSGSKRQRFVRAGLIGFGAATVGALAGGVIGGIAGTAAVTAGAAATVTGVTRFAKAYAKRDNKEGRGLSDVTEAHVSAAEESVQSKPSVDAFESAQDYFNSQLENDTKKEKMKRLRSVAFGLGAVAVGGTLATTIAFVAETGVVQQAYESTKDFIGGLGVDAQPPVETPTIYADDFREPLDLHVDHVPETSVEAPVVEAPVSDPNFSVTEGQGGIQFFQEKLGLSESQWNEIAGDLRKNFPDEFYDHGTEVRIQNSGGLSIPAQQFIKNRFGL